MSSPWDKFSQEKLKKIFSEKKYIVDICRTIKKNGFLIITGTPNLIYPISVYHKPYILFLPWMTSKVAHHYAIFLGKWERGKSLDSSGRKGTTFWHIKKWLKDYKYEIINLQDNFTSKYLIKHNRLNTVKRRILIKPYMYLEYILAKLFKIPITAIMPSINHLFIKKL